LSSARETRRKRGRGDSGTMQNGKYEGKGVCINGKEGGGILELYRTEKMRGRGAV